MAAIVPDVLPAAAAALPADATLAELLERLGNVPPERIRVFPPLGTATEQDVIAAEARDHICELIDGVLVEKTMGYLESIVAIAIARHLGNYVAARQLGVVLGADGTLKVLPDQVRIPDVCFIAWDRFPNGKLLPQPIPPVAPDLAVEVLSKGNTEGEMQRKLRDYFAAGVRLVWYIDPRSRTAAAYTSAEQCVVLDQQQALDGGDVLPGFTLPLAEVFAELDRHAG
jgi:Uma2 family endonuclease